MRRLVARHDEQADGARLRRPAPRRRRPPRRRRCRGRSASRGGRRRRSRPCRRARAARRTRRRARRARPPGPDQIEHGAVGAAHGLLVELVQDARALAPRRLDPEVDDRRPLGDGHVAEDDDHLCVADRRQRQPVRVERVGDLFREDRLVPAEPAQELRERVRLLDRLRAGEGGDDAAAGGAQEPLRLVDRVVPRDGLEAAAADALDRVDDPVLGADVREREAALVADPALVDLGMVPGQDALDLALARRRVDVAADRAEAADRSGRS